jgi:hypothetical protein
MKPRSKMAVLLASLTAVQVFGCFLAAAAVASSTAESGGVNEMPPLPIAKWSPSDFDKFTRIEIGRTGKPWLNLIGNGLFGGHIIFMLDNRNDGRAFRIDTRKNAMTDADLHLDVAGEAIRQTTHGIGYSTLAFGSDPASSVCVTYSIEPDASDSEIWIIENTAGLDVRLHYRSKSATFRRSLALRVLGNSIDEIPLRTATNELAKTKQRWQDYLAHGIETMHVRNVSNPLLMREFIWDTYQVAVMVSSDAFPQPNAGVHALRTANMGSGYTFLGLDVHGRDTLQMVPAISEFDPALAREILLDFARYTDKTGRVIHHKLLSGQPIDRGHSDESYWFALALTEYLRNTHDLGVLADRVPYLDNELKSEYVLFKDPQWVQRYHDKTLDQARFTAEKTTMLEHLRRTLQSVRFGPHGVPLMEDGDWNDALNKMQNGESVMNAGLYAWSLLKMQELWRQLGKDKVDVLLGEGSYARDLPDFATRYEQMKKAVNENAWDGQWYVRGFDNSGKAFGSHLNPQGKIYLNAQSWLILAGIPDAARTQSMIDAVDRYLTKDKKVVMMAPAYTTPDDTIGNITHLPRGSNENGGEWRQCTLWWIHALEKLGREQDAIQLFNPLMLANADLKKLGTEPYLYNEYMTGPESADPGSSGGQAHVQQSALVLGDLAELYPQVTITGRYATHYDMPGIEMQEYLYSITSTGQPVPWKPLWTENPPKYVLTPLR